MQIGHNGKATPTGEETAGLPQLPPAFHRLLTTTLLNVETGERERRARRFALHGIDSDIATREPA